MKKAIPLLLCALALVRGAPALAQGGDGGPDTSNVKVRIGPLLMNPTIGLTNVGVDHNVFNDPPDKQPKQDFTFTVTPTTDFWVHLGPTWLSATLFEQINWYQKYSSERTANNTYKLGWTGTGAKMSFKVNGSYLNARERPGFEIDTRAERKETTVNTAVDFNALSKTYIGVTAARQQTRFADDATFLDPASGLDVNLKTELDRVDSTYGLTLRHQLTPLTSLTLIATRAQADFTNRPDRNTKSNGVSGTVTFSPAALLSGAASFGYTDFKPDDPALPKYSGLIADVNLTYVLLGATRFALNANRSVQYSYDNNQPYYVQSRIGGSIAQELFGPLDVQVRGDIAWLDYRDRAGVVIAVQNRTDRVTTIGIGLGLHMGKDLRLSFNVDQNNRDTRVFEHAYEKFLVGTSLVYGF